jgi:hypothetical protein
MLAGLDVDRYVFFIQFFSFAHILAIKKFYANYTRPV